MATMQRRLVHKQFNSPINLYSQRNIQETLDRELKQLSNGAIGIDFDDPSTTKPPSLAKSAVLQALEEEERQQQGRGKGFFPQQPSRPSRSRQREPEPERARTPCINRDTVLRINRRPVRHRSCDSFWPPAAQGRRQADRSVSPRGGGNGGTNLGGTEGGSFAYDVGSYGHYGSHESVYFDERVRKQHKIDPLRTMFDKANVVLVDWGGKNRAVGQPSSRLSDNGVYDRRCQEREEKVVGDDDAGNNSVKQGEMIESEAKAPTPDVAPPPAPPPLPPPRRYFLPMEQLRSGVGIEILLRCYGEEGPPPSFNQSESQEISTFKIDDGGTDSRQQAKQPPPPTAAFPAFTEDRTLHQDGIQSKPPLKSRATPTKRFPSIKPPTPPTNFPVNHSDDPSSTTTNQDEFNINSNTILNLNIDNTLASTTVPRITVTDCPQNQQQQQPQRGATSKTNDQLWREIIDENHNYNEKLITNSSGTRPDPDFDFADDPQQPPHEQHSKLNVSNQANRNWINLNSNEIYPHSAVDGAAPAAARVTTTEARVPNSNDDPQLEQQQLPANPPARPDNYDNKSIKSNYWTGEDSLLRRSESRGSTRSWQLEFPPPPAYPCDCDPPDEPALSSGRCSVEQERAQSHDNHRGRGVVPSFAGDNPTISQSCRQDSTAASADVCPSFGDGDGRWDDNHATRVTAVTDDYFKTNLTDDEFLNENVNTACNLRRDKSKHRQLNCGSISPVDDHQPGQASSSLPKSIDNDAFLAHERRHQAWSKNSWQIPDQNSHQQMSFTDGEYIFGPYDQHSEEFQHFNLWSSEFRQLRRNCHHHHQGGGGGSSSSSGTTLVPPTRSHGDGGGSSCSCSIISSSDTLRDEEDLANEKTPEWRQPTTTFKQVENYDGTPGNGLKRVAWPPSAEGGDEYEQVQQQPQQHQPQQQQYYQQPQQQQHHQPAPAYQPFQQPQAQQQQQPRERIIPIQRATSHVSPQRTPKSPLGGGSYQQQPKYPQPQQQQQYQQPRAASSTVAFSGGRAVLPQQPPQQQQQQYYQPAPRPVSAPYHQQVQQQNRYSSPSTASLGSPRSPQIVGGHSPRGWAHVQSPVPVYHPAPQHQPQQQQQQQYVPPPFLTESNPSVPYHRQASSGQAGYGPRKPEQQQQYQPQPTEAFQPLVSQQQQQQFYQPEQQQLHQQQKHQPEPVPFFTTLRSEPPMSQEPAPVYQTQPVAAIYQGGSNMRGDQKWPPAEVKKQSELENEERRRLAQEPAFRPRKVQKDYSSFFAKNALNQTYPGYRAPPGTQHHS